MRTPLPPEHRQASEQQHGAPQQRRRVNGMIAAEFPLGAAAASVYKVSEESYRPQVVSPIATEKPPVCLGELRAAAAHLAMVDPERVHALVARARAAAWLPELRVRAEKRWGRNQSVDLNNDTTLAPLGLDTVNDFRLEVRASWDLARLVYSPDELAISTAGVRAANAGQDLALLINRLFFSRRQHRKALEMSQGPGTNQVPTSGDKGDADGQEPTTSPSRERLAQITADLDALTGGLGNNCW